MFSSWIIPDQVCTDFSRDLQSSNLNSPSPSCKISSFKCVYSDYGAYLCCSRAGSTSKLKTPFTAALSAVNALCAAPEAGLITCSTQIEVNRQPHWLLYKLKEQKTQLTARSKYCKLGKHVKSHYLWSSSQECRCYVLFYCSCKTVLFYRELRCSLQSHRNTFTVTWIPGGHCIQARAKSTTKW